MSAGDILNPKRVRWEANERVDGVDADALSAELIEHTDALTRSQLFTPRNLGGTAPTGLIVTGFGLQLNPTGGSDGKVRVLSALGVAIDADGRRIIKDNGLQHDVSIPAGSQQLYVYWNEVAIENLTRRFISVTSPFGESPRGVETKYQSSYGFFVRAGNASSIVASDNVNGQTRALVCIGIVTNTAGVVACTGHNAITAPNGTDIVNRLSTIVPAGTPPTSSVISGSIKTLHEMVQALGHTIGQTAWKGSLGLTPSAANNYGAYNTPAGGADAAFRGSPGFFTIGNGTTVIGDYNTSDFARADLLFTALIAALPTTGGYVYIKRGVNLSNWNGATFALPASKTVEIVGDHSNLPSGTPQITFAASEAFSASGSGRLILRNLHIRWVTNAVSMAAGAQLHVFDSFLEKNVSAVDTGAAISGSTTTEMYMRDVQCSVNVNAPTSNGMFVRMTGTCRRVRIERVRLYQDTGEAFVGIDLQDIREDVIIDDVRYDLNGSTTYNPTIVKLGSLDNATDVENRYVRKLYSASPKVAGVEFTSAGWVTVEDCDVGYWISFAATYSGTGPLITNRSKGLGFDFGGPVPSFVARDCIIIGSGGRVGGAGAVQGRHAFERCTFKQNLGTTGFSGHVMQHLGTTIEEIRYNNCTFEDIGDTTTRFGCVEITATTYIRTFVAEQCKFHNIQNVVWAGSDVSTNCFEINTEQMQTCLVKGCVVTKSMSSSSGNARKGLYLLEINSSDRSGTSGEFGNVQMFSNHLGDQDPSGSFFYCSLMLVKMSNFNFISQLGFFDNFVTSVYDNGGSGKASLENIVNCASSVSVAVNPGDIICHGNVMRLKQGDGNLSSIAIDFFRFSKNGGTSQLANVSFVGNQFAVESSSAAFDGTNGFGINFVTWNTWNVTFQGNAFVYFANGTNVLKYRQNSGTTNFNSTGGTIPTSGNAMPGIQIARF